MSALMMGSPELLMPDGIFYLVRSRQMGALTTFTIMIENYRMDELGRHEHARTMIRALGCGCCGASEADGVSFSFCSRCKFIVYCSKECQKEHWKKHKTICLTRD